MRAEDASKINRIFERFKLASVDMGSVKSTIERERADKKPDMSVPEHTAPEKSKEDLFIEELLKPAPSKEEAQTKNPTEARIAKSRQSEPSSPMKSKSERTKADPTESRPSVRQELKEIKNEMRNVETKGRDKAKTDTPIMVKTCGSFTEVKKPEHALKLFVRFALAKGVITYGMELMLALLDIIQGIISQIMRLKRQPKQLRLW